MYIYIYICLLGVGSSCVAPIVSEDQDVEGHEADEEVREVVVRDVRPAYEELQHLALVEGHHQVPSGGGPRSHNNNNNNNNNNSNNTDNNNDNKHNNNNNNNDTNDTGSSSAWPARWACRPPRPARRAGERRRPA